ncbi:ATP-binding protein [Calothrix sp. PCC 7507]|uniref:ATP-binding protein n=1 Tax=Calothrix sp. PCC 7507 TaxID=99598 RepID=UPI001F1E1675|nr:ATP-binding protein [Calothrix sp. PCC 7507]
MTDQIFAGKSEMAMLMRSHDWSQTSLGAVETWPQSLKTAVRIMLTSSQPMWVWWGSELVNLYNDAYRTVLGGKHPALFARPGVEVWPEIWDEVGPRVEYAMLNNEGTYDESLLFIMERNGYPEETYYTFSYSPIPDDQGNPGGIICANTDDTQRIVGERQLALLQALAARTADARTFDAACTLSASCLETNLYDFPFAMIYLVDPDQQRVVLAGTSGIDRKHPAVPEVVNLDVDSAWSFREVMQTQQSVLISDLIDQFGNLPTGAWDRVPQQAVVSPIPPSGQTGRSGILVAGLNPLRLFDDNYRSFIDLVTGQISASVANAQTYEDERKRAEALAELDRAKTLFFSNVSHEFRTPLTLILSPLEEAIANLDGTIPDQEREQLQMVQRNGMRLLKLVNSLLDFSRIEAGRVQASYEPVDLAMYTAELASAFRSLIEQAGMSLIVDCPSLPAAVYVDREMWEKIVLNLLSNAFKFTLAGGITVRLQWLEHQVELTVADTGVGIPSGELPHLFERFHRVENSQGRSFEGSGIGLSLVQELVKLHGGTISVTSTVGQGSCFTVAIPTGTTHLPNEQIRAARTLTSTALGVMPYVEEAQRWLPQEDGGREQGEIGDLRKNYNSPSFPSPQSKIQNPKSKILLADDNADMREYIRRLLSGAYTVEIAADGIAAMKAIQHNPPDLVLTDVMMPGMDGFELLRSLRSHPTTQDIPIILLSARAGEESRIEGLEAGADDYLIKPFSARELLARVEASLKLARLRQEATVRERTILDRVTDGFMALDLDFRLTYANVAAEQLSQTPLAAMLGKTIWESFPAARGTQFEFQYRRSLSQQVAVEFQEYYAPLDLWVEVHVYPSPTGLSLFFRDINDRKRAEAVRLRLAAEREQLLKREQAAREAAETANRIKDEFLAVLSHELRSPLNPILGWSKLLQTHKFNEQRTAEALATIERNAKLQSELIEDLLDVSRILQGKLSLNPCPVDLTATIQGGLETVRLAAEAKLIHIETHLDCKVGQVSGDPARLQQVVWNLLSNAVKFTPKGGRVEVRLNQIEDYAQITVRDTGKGITVDFLPYVFDYFRQQDGATNRKFSGLGLGLAIVRHLVELHGGTVQAESPGEELGATFTVRLPLMPIQSAVKPDYPDAESSFDLNGVQILVIDDETDSREFVAFVLEEAGATVITATSAEEGFAALRQFQPRVLLSDIGMPDMDGYMLIRKIRALSPEEGGTVLAIALTAYAGDFNQQQALQSGFQYHFAKPIEPDKLIKTIADIVGNGE